MSEVRSKPIGLSRHATLLVHSQQRRLVHLQQRRLVHLQQRQSRAGVAECQMNPPQGSAIHALPGLPAWPIGFRANLRQWGNPEERPNPEMWDFQRLVLRQRLESLLKRPSICVLLSGGEDFYPNCRIIPPAPLKRLYLHRGRL